VCRCQLPKSVCRSQCAEVSVPASARGNRTWRYSMPPSRACRGQRANMPTGSRRHVRKSSQSAPPWTDTLGILLSRVTGLSGSTSRCEGRERCLVLLLALVSLWFLFLAVASHLTFRHITLLLLQCDDARQRDAQQFARRIRRNSRLALGTCGLGIGGSGGKRLGHADMRPSARAHRAGGAARRVSG